ncbi:MAG: DUF421 domain-containing protein [Actinobacteria bacterium]|nr:DUF421 domain-containing protein [Actinomycetota bacterium]
MDEPDPDNPPVLVFLDGEFLTPPLHRTHLSEADLLEKVRLQGVSSMDHVRAVVFERNGGVSILTGEDIDPALLTNVRGAERLQGT